MNNSEGQRVVIWCHGGCFGGGSADYDRSLRDHLTNTGFQVFSVDFPTDNYPKTIELLLSISQDLEKCGRKYIFAGVSSGGFLAHVMGNACNVPVFLLCPVLQPFKRHETLEEKFRKLQLRFFGSEDIMQKAQEGVEISPPLTPRYVIYGRDDKKAPFPHIFNILMKGEGARITLIEKAAGHELCKNPPLDDILIGVTSLFSKDSKKTVSQIARDFIDCPLNQDLTKVPGLGSGNIELLKACGIDTTDKLVGNFFCVDRNPQYFIEWLTEGIGFRPQDARETADKFFRKFSKI